MNTTEFEIIDTTLIKYIGDSHNVVIPEGITDIADNAFKGLYWIESIELPTTLKTIGKNAFKGCNHITNITIPESVEYIGAYAFHKCRMLEGIKFSDNITKVESCTFLACDSLKWFIGNNVKELGMQAFNSCNSLYKLVFNKDIDYTNFNSDVFTGNLKIKEIDFNDGSNYIIENLVTEMGEINDTLDHKHKVIKAIANNVYKILTVENDILKRFGINTRSVNIPEGIKGIGSGAFSGFKGIQEIIFPDTLNTIGNNAFNNCITLERVAFSNCNVELSSTSFNGCTSLNRVYIKDIDTEFVLSDISIYDTNIPTFILKIREQILNDFLISGRILVKYLGHNDTVHIPKEISIIGKSAFEHNDRIKRIICHSNITTIEERAFKDCSSMISIEVISSNESINVYDKAFDGCVSLLKICRLEQTNDSIIMNQSGEFTFRNCKNLNTDNLDIRIECSSRPVILPTNNYIINDYQYCRDNSIKSLNIDDSYGYDKYIGKYAFSGCSSIESITITNKSCYLGPHTFEKCKNLKSVEIHTNYIPISAFAYCRNLETITIISDTGVYIDNEAFIGCTNLKHINVIGSIIHIGIKAFCECESIDSIPNNITGTISGYAFERCIRLTELSLNNIILEQNAFMDCTNIKTLNIGSNVNMHSSAFCGCTYVQKIVYNNKSYTDVSVTRGFTSINNDYPDIIANIISSMYSCFNFNNKYDIISYLGDADNVRIPEGVYNIGDNAFRNHVRLIHIDFPSTLKSIGKLSLSSTDYIDNNKLNGLGPIVVNNMILHCGKVNEEVRINKDINKVCSWSFSGEIGIKTLIIESSDTIIEPYAFRNCCNINKIIVESGINKGEYTFKSMTDLTTDNYPDTIYKIFTECYNCYKMDGNKLVESTGNISNLTLPLGIHEICNGVYNSCNLLEKFETSTDVKVIGNEVFKESKWLVECNLPNVEVIGSKVFTDCLQLTKVTIPNLKSIGKRSFENCTNLTEVILGNIEEIPDKLFFGCKKLKTITIPNTVKKIGSKAFAYCTNLEEIIYNGNIDDIDIAEDAFLLIPKINWRNI